MENFRRREQATRYEDLEKFVRGGKVREKVLIKSEVKEEELKLEKFEKKGESNRELGLAESRERDMERERERRRECVRK